MADRVIDLRSAIAPMRRRWYLVVLAAVVGLQLGLLYAARVPPQLSSTALVLLSANGASDGAGGDDALTQVHIVQSGPVLTKAGASLRPALTASEAADRVDVQATTSRLLQIDVLSPDPRQAQGLAQAVADAYVTTLQDSVRTVQGVIAGDLRDRQAALTRQIQDLEQTITSTKARVQREPRTSPAGIRDAQLLAQLVLQRVTLATQ